VIHLVLAQLQEPDKLNKMLQIPWRPTIKAVIIRVDSERQLNPEVLLYQPRSTIKAVIIQVDSERQLNLDVLLYQLDQPNHLRNHLLMP
jgi:hypothetical protein